MPVLVLFWLSSSARPSAALAGDNDARGCASAMLLVSSDGGNTLCQYWHLLSNHDDASAVHGYNKSTCKTSW